jgi:hypothetical protein
VVRSGDMKRGSSMIIMDQAIRYHFDVELAGRRHVFADNGIVEREAVISEGDKRVVALNARSTVRSEFDRLRAGERDYPSILHPVIVR